MGSAHLARVQFWPALKNMPMCSLRVLEDGVREPHWHPITAEMGYVQRGSARMTVMDPDGTLDTWYLQQGDVYFVHRRPGGLMPVTSLLVPIARTGSGEAVDPVSLRRPAQRG